MYSELCFRENHVLMAAANGYRDLQVVTVVHHDPTIELGTHGREEQPQERYLYLKLQS